MAAFGTVFARFLPLFNFVLFKNRAKRLFRHLINWRKLFGNVSFLKWLKHFADILCSLSKRALGRFFIDIFCNLLRRLLMQFFMRFSLLIGQLYHWLLFRWFTWLILGWSWIMNRNRRCIWNWWGAINTYGLPIESLLCFRSRLCRLNFSWLRIFLRIIIFSIRRYLGMFTTLLSGL